MLKKMICLTATGLLTFQNCVGMDDRRFEKETFDYCKYKLDNAITNRYIKHGVIKDCKPRKNESDYDRFLDKLETHPKSKGRDLSRFVLYRSLKHFWQIKDGVCTISDNILAISRCTFLNNKEIKAVILPNSLLGIDCFAFAKTDIESIYIPDSVVAIAPCAFYNCKNLEYVSVSRKTLGVEDAFAGCFEIEFDYR